MRKNVNFFLRNETEQFAQFILRIYKLVQERYFPFSNQSRYGVKTEIILTFHYNVTWSRFENVYQNYSAGKVCVMLIFNLTPGQQCQYGMTGCWYVRIEFQLLINCFQHWGCSRSKAGERNVCCRQIHSQVSLSRV